MRHRRISALHLLWTVPVAAALAVVPWFIGGFSLCGVSGCSGGGFGPAYGPDYEWIIPYTVVGLLLGLSVGLVPWARPAIRLPIALGIAVVIAGVLIVSGYDAKYPLVR